MMEDTETETAVAGAEDTGASTEAAQAPKDDKPTKRPWFEQRIAQLTARNTAESERATRAEREAEILRAMVEGKKAEAGAEAATAPQPKAMSQADIERMVDQRAAVKAAEAEFTSACNATYESGKKEFDDFDAAVSALNTSFKDQIGREFLEGINAVPNGAAVYHHLGNNPDDAARILGLKPVRMAIELAKLSDALAKPRAQSKAPKPVSPVETRGARREPSIHDDDLPMKEWVKLREKQLADRAG